MNYELWKKNRKFAVSFVFLTVFLTSFSPFFAKKAEAQWPVWDPMNFVPNLAGQIKTYGLDGVAWSLTNKIIERISASTVNWINSGFKGSPAFITNPEKYFTNMGDQLAGEYIFSGNSELNMLCGPLRNKIKLALAKNYSQGDRNRFTCTLSSVAGNVDGFMNNFENGGWNTFFELSQSPQNNPLGMYMMAEGELFNKIANKQEKINKELDRGGGFLSYKKCKPGTEVKTSDLGTDENGLTNCDIAYNSCIKWANGDPKTAEAEGKKCNDIAKACRDKYTNVGVGDCADSEKETVTPGSVIESKLNEALGSGAKRLNVAKQINEIVGALLSQLADRAMKGLFSLSQPDSTSGNKSFADQLKNIDETKKTKEECEAAGKVWVGEACTEQVVDYFNQTQNLDILKTEVPPYNPDASKTPTLETMTDKELIQQWKTLDDQLKVSTSNSEKESINFRINQIMEELAKRGVCVASGATSGTVCTLENMLPLLNTSADSASSRGGTTGGR